MRQLQLTATSLTIQLLCNSYSNFLTADCTADCAVIIAYISQQLDLSQQLHCSSSQFNSEATVQSLVCLSVRQSHPITMLKGKPNAASVPIHTQGQTIQLWHWREFVAKSENRLTTFGRIWIALHFVPELTTSQTRIFSETELHLVLCLYAILQHLLGTHDACNEHL